MKSQVIHRVESALNINRTQCGRAIHSYTRAVGPWSKVTCKGCLKHKPQSKEEFEPQYFFIAYRLYTSPTSYGVGNLWMKINSKESLDNLQIGMKKSIAKIDLGNENEWRKTCILFYDRMTKAQFDALVAADGKEPTTVDIT